MPSIYNERVEKLRSLMKQEKIDAYLIVTDDFHGSEYASDYFKGRAYVSGFTGSAGSLLVMQNFAGLWTDGRYFLQAKEQLQGSGITLMKMGEKDCPTIARFLSQNLADGQVLGYDGRCISVSFARELEEALSVDGREKDNTNQSEEYARKIRDDIDLLDSIWTDRPSLPERKVWELSEEYAGESRRSKIARLRKELQEQKAECHLLSSLMDIAWLLNLRGSDIAYCPVFLSYLLITKDEIRLYVAKDVISPELTDKLQRDGVTIYPYFAIYEDLKALPKDASILYDRGAINVALLHAIPEGGTHIDKENPTTLWKAKKNEAEMENERLAHIKDGVAVTKLLYWLSKREADGAFARAEETELSACEKLLNLRRQQKDFIDQSFEPIIASGSHGAIIHYDPTPETNVPIEENTFLLMDTGGHYLQGTTDITRTVVIGQVSSEMKEHYTRVLKGNLRLAAATFREGVTGPKLDAIARQPLWEAGLDYNHGTGHGVGYLLSVHEGPQTISYRNQNNKTTFSEGMLTSDEPGLYIPGKYGIRLENLMLCHKTSETEFGSFYGFETITMVPFDRRAIVPELLDEKEKTILNAYHEKVYKTISPCLNQEEADWLREQTKAM